MKAMVSVALAALVLTGCGSTETPQGNNMAAEAAMGITITSSAFGALPDGREVTRWELKNASGAGVAIMDLGATVLSVMVPGRDGTLEDVAFGFDTPAPYLTDSPYFGAVVGRFANRIAGGKFTLDGKEYQLPQNDGPNTLHGGEIGFDKRIWKGERVETEDGPGVRFTLVSEDGDQGFPGEVTVTTTYVWTDDNRLIVDYGATSTAPTPFNVSQHSYWNLDGAADATTALDHILQINADRYLPVDETLIPTGELASVEGTPFDFREPKPVGRDIEADNEQLRRGGGYDHNWVLNGTGFREVAVVTDPDSGRRMTVSTTEPGMQFYSGNFLDGSVTGKGGNAYPHRSAVVLETQHFPDSPNQPEFPDTILRPGEEYQSRTVFAFSVVE